MTAPFDPNAPDPKRKRRWPLVAGVLLLLALIVAGLWPSALPVEIATVARANLQVTVDEEGRTRVQNRYIVSAPATGRLRRIELKPGAPVEAGKTVVAILETAGVDLLDARALDQARARLQAAISAQSQVGARQAAAQTALDLARTELARARRLTETGVISQQELDAAQARETTAAQELRAAEFAAQTAGYEVAQAEAFLRRYDSPEKGESPTLVLHAPVGGRVLRVMQESARDVTRGTPLLELGDPADLEIVIETLSRDAVAIAPGATVLLERWGGDQTLTARVRLVEPSGFTKISALGVEEQRVNVIADFTGPPADHAALGDGYRVETRIVTWEGRDVSLVPAGALFQREGGWQTFVVDGNRARLRTVRPGRSNGIHTEILDGLGEGESVILYPGDRVADGVRVRGLSVSD